MKPVFATISFHATAVVYTGGTVAQLLKLYYAFPWTEMPFIIDWLIVSVGSVGASGLIWYHRRIAYRGVWEKFVHWAIVLHLSISVGLHAWTIIQGNHDFYGSFPYGYSYFAVLYFGFFAWRSWTIRLEQ